MMEDEAVSVKDEVDETLKGCEAVIVGEDHHKVLFPGLAMKPSLQGLDHCSMVHL